MIDWDRVNELRDEIGVEDFEEIVPIFLSEVEERLDELSATKSAQDQEEDMHFLKGSALNLGFSDFAALCHAGEKNAAAGRPVDPPEMIRKVYQMSKDAFLSERKDDASV